MTAAALQGGGVRAAVTHRLAFSGGSCVALEGPPEGLQEPSAVQLYSACVPVPSGGLDVSFVVACSGGGGGSTAGGSTAGGRVGLVLWLDGAEASSRSGPGAAAPSSSGTESGSRGAAVVLLGDEGAGVPSALQQQGAGRGRGRTKKHKRFRSRASGQRRA